MTHFHGYGWDGFSDELGKRSMAERRPEGGPLFQSSDLTPEITWWLLLRPAPPKGTWDEPDAAVEWMYRWYASVEDRLMYPEQGTPTADHMREFWAAELKVENDISTHLWLSGSRIAQRQVLCCPNRRAPAGTRCPAGR